MADNVAITAGSGTSIATDDAGAGGHVQVMKLAISTDGSATYIPADTTNGLDVDVTRVIPGTTATALGKAEDAAHADGDTGVLVLGVRNHSGAGSDGDYGAMRINTEGMVEVVPRGNLVRVAVTSGGLTTATTAYTAGDQVGTQFTIAGAARASGGYGRVRSIVLHDLQDIIGAYEVALFRASATPAADNAAFSISTTDVVNLIAVVPLNGAYDIGATRVAQALNLDIPYDCSGGTSLYACLQTKGAHTFFTGGTDRLRLVVHLELS